MATFTNSGSLIPNLEPVFRKKRWRIQYGGRILKKCSNLSRKWARGVFGAADSESNECFLIFKAADPKWQTLLSTNAFFSLTYKLPKIAEGKTRSCASILPIFNTNLFLSKTSILVFVRSKLVDIYSNYKGKTFFCVQGTALHRYRDPSSPSAPLKLSQTCSETFKTCKKRIYKNIFCPKLITFLILFQ